MKTKNEKVVAPELQSRRASELSSRRGQLLVEAIVASSVLVVGFMGILGLLSQSIHVNRIVTDNYRGSYLAAEGIEIIKNMIDFNTIQNIRNCTGIPKPCALAVLWDFLPGFTLDTVPYRVDYSSAALTVGVGSNLRFDASKNLYGYSSGFQTNLRRTIRLTHITLPKGQEELVVRSIVQWVTGTTTWQVEADDTFYNWFPIQ